jgi:hypothetical protein
MVDGLHIQNRAMKSLAIALSEVGGKGDGSNQTNVQCKIYSEFSQ